MLPNDVYHDIFLYLTVDDIENYCMTQQIKLPVCYSSSFWMDKFKQDNLPMMNPYPTNWINEYKRVFLAKQLANHVIQLVVAENYTYPYKIQIIDYPKKTSLDELKKFSTLMNTTVPQGEANYWLTFDAQTVDP